MNRPSDVCRYIDASAMGLEILGIAQGWRIMNEPVSLPPAAHIV
jgi:hypothetical protein